jgi:hypothetical protein
MVVHDGLTLVDLRDSSHRARLAESPVGPVSPRLTH